MGCRNYHRVGCCLGGMAKRDATRCWGGTAVGVSAVGHAPRGGRFGPYCGLGASWYYRPAAERSGASVCFRFSWCGASSCVCWVAVCSGVCRFGTAADRPRGDGFGSWGGHVAVGYYMENFASSVIPFHCCGDEFGFCPFVGRVWHDPHVCWFAAWGYTNDAGWHLCGAGGQPAARVCVGRNPHYVGGIVADCSRIAHVHGAPASPVSACNRNVGRRPLSRTHQPYQRWRGRNGEVRERRYALPCQ